MYESRLRNTSPHEFNHTSASLPDAVRMASLTPARRIGVDAEVGSLEVGKFADVQILSSDLYTQRVFVGGVEFERSFDEP